jgi:hypothetical protein
LPGFQPGRGARDVDRDAIFILEAGDIVKVRAD